MPKGKAEVTEKYGVISSSKVQFENGEPVFLIRATDPLAVPTVIEYARHAERTGCERDHVDAAFDHAMRIAEWQRQWPEKVKDKPD